MAQSLGCPYGNDVWLRTAPPGHEGATVIQCPPRLFIVPGDCCLNPLLLLVTCLKVDRRAISPKFGAWANGDS